MWSAENDAELFPMALRPKVQTKLMGYVNMLQHCYERFGQVDKHMTNFNLIVPSSFGSDRRVPVSKPFQRLGEQIVIPDLCRYLFGDDGWAEIEPFLRTFKLNTIPYGKGHDYYGTDAYHMHVDNKPGPLNPKDIGQVRRIRLLFTVVPHRTKQKCSTVYLKHQPKEGFHRQRDYHAYMRSRYSHLLSGGRPIYEIPPEDVFRTEPGTIAVHKSHPGYPIHAEPNPCPEGRGVFMFDFEDQRTMDGYRILKNDRIPIDRILECLKKHCE